MTIQTGGFSATANRPGLLFGAESKRKKAGEGDAPAAEDTTPPEEPGDLITLGTGDTETPLIGFDDLDLSGTSGKDDISSDPPPAADEEPPLDAPPDEPAQKHGLFTVKGLLDKARVAIASLLDFENPELTGWIDIVVKAAKMFIDKNTAGAPPVPGKS